MHLNATNNSSKIVSADFVSGWQIKVRFSVTNINVQSETDKGDCQRRGRMAIHVWAKFGGGQSTTMVTTTKRVTLFAQLNTFVSGRAAWNQISSRSQTGLSESTRGFDSVTAPSLCIAFRTLSSSWPSPRQLRLFTQTLMSSSSSAAFGC